METSYFGAYWGDRKESSVECAQRLAEFLAALGELDPLLASWRHKGPTRASAKAPVDTTPVGLERVILEESDRSVHARRAVTLELGFVFGMWNGQEPAVGLRGAVGGFAGVPGLVNSLGLDIPAPVGEAARLYDRSVAIGIAEAVVQAWEPDWATWVPRSIRDLQEAPPRTPVVGWMTFLSAARLTPEQAAAVGAERMSSGWLVRTGDTAGGLDAEAVLTLRHELNTAGALAPIPLR